MGLHIGPRGAFSLGLSASLNKATGEVIPVSLAIPENYPEGAVVYRAQPSSGVATSFSVPNDCGFSVDDAGYVSIADSSVALAGIPKSVDVTIKKVGGAEIARLNLGSSANYIDFMPLKENIDFWIDALDNRFLQLTGDGQTLQEVADKVDANRRFRNDLYTDRRPIWSNSVIDASKKAIRFAPPSDTSVYGLFAPESPIWEGLQRLQIATNSIVARHDLKYKPNTPGQAGAATADFPNVAHALTVNQPALLTMIGNKAAGTLTFRKNGTQIGISSGWSFNSDFITFALFCPSTVVGQVWSNAALGQGHIWKQGAYKGDLSEVVTIMGATVSA